jgi:hypothetical protein
MKTYDLFWLNNPKILIDPKRLNEFFPHPSMTRVEQLNSIVRFSLYLGLLLTVIKMNLNYLFIFFVGLIITFLIFQFEPTIREDEKIEKYEVYKTKNPKDKKKVYVKPTYDNPFMNPTLIDINENPEREAYSKKSFINNDEVANEIEDKFSYNLYQDVSDVFGKSNSQRQFYTVPSTTIPNDQDSFAKWLYGRQPSCKENNGFQCIQNNDRYLDGESRPIIY